MLFKLLNLWSGSVKIAGKIFTLLTFSVLLISCGSDRNTDEKDLTAKKFGKYKCTANEVAINVAKEQTATNVTCVFFSPNKLDTWSCTQTGGDDNLDAGGDNKTVGTFNQYINSKCQVD